MTCLVCGLEVKVRLPAHCQGSADDESLWVLDRLEVLEHVRSCAAVALEPS